MKLSTPLLVAFCTLAFQPGTRGQCEIDRLDPSGSFDDLAFTGGFEGDLIVLAGGANEVAVFQRLPGGWTPVVTLASPGDTLFEQVRVGSSRDVIATGMIETPLSGVMSGRVYVFERQNGWAQPTVLQGSDAQGFYSFGDAISISGDTMAIGASMQIQDVLCGPGKLYVFERGPSGWAETADFHPHGYTNDMDDYGVQIETDGRTIVVGASTDDERFAAAGAAYVYERGATGWVERAKLFAPDARRFHHFGTSVAVDGTTMLVSAEESVYVFERSAQGWARRQVLVAGDGQEGDGFGHRVAIEGDMAVVSAPGVDTNTSDDVGAVYAFRRVAGVWEETFRIVADDAPGGSRFGSGMQLDSNQVLWMPGTWSALPSRLSSLGLGSQASYCTATPNSSGAAASISAAGCDSLLAGQLTLLAKGVPADRLGLFLYSAGPAQTPFANGFLCLGGPVHRLAPTSADANGQMSTSVDFQSAQASFLTPGTTWYFQAYFRDPGVGTGANTSDGLSLLLTP